MLNLNVQIGKNPLEKHKPIYFKSYEQLKIPFSYTVGEDGQIVAWKTSTLSDQSILQQKSPNNFTPVYYMIPSLNGDHQKCISLVITQLRLINQQEKTYKIVTYHQDNRLRIWQVRDGSCINISGHNCFPEKIIGLCENNIAESRFIFSFSQNSIFIFDCWTMKVVDKLQPKKEVYSQFLKGRLNQNKQLELYDNYHKSYKLDISKLFKQSFLDVGRTINSSEKVRKQLKQVVQSLYEEKLILVHKIWKTQDFKTPLKAIIESQNYILKRQNLLSTLFENNFLKRFPELQNALPQDNEITIQNAFFVKGNNLWYFLGTQQGRIQGFPAVAQKSAEYHIVKDQSNANKQRKNPVKYLNLVDNLLFASWQDGSFKVYTVDSMLYMIEQKISMKNLEKIEKNQNIRLFNLQKLSILSQNLSASIKYTLPIYILSSTPTSVSSSKVGSQETAFQLENNQIVIFDSLHHRVSHYVGIQENKKVYVVVYLSGSSEYVGIGTEQGIQVFGPEGYQRRINYRDWQWKQWGIFPKYQLKQVSNGFHSDTSNSLQLIEFSNRHTIDQIQYSASLSQLLQETFGCMDTHNFTNQVYSKFYFLDKPQVERSLHSRSMQKYIAILKHKHNSYRRDRSVNTSFIVNCSLNRELDAYYTAGVDSSLQQAIQDNFIFYSCFLWDMFEIPFLTKLLSTVKKQFVLKRRYATQGIGKSFTIYFDLEQSIFRLSKYLLTEYAIAAISFMQCYVLKQIEQADQLVAVVEYFTLRNQIPYIYVSGEILSKSIISTNQNIVKACINLLISTIIAGHSNIHPLYEYFVLNLKNMEEKKELLTLGSSISPNKNSTSLIQNVSQSNSLSSLKQVTPIQCEWMLYLSLCVIYGKEKIQKQQIKMLLNRVIQCIQITNFIKKPDLVQVILKIFNEGLSQTWKEHLTKEAVVKLYLELFRIFFYYDGLGNISPEDKKFYFCFENNTPQQIKRMKHSLIKSIVYLSKQFNNEFIQCLTTQTVNQKPHTYYPASVIQILRQYLKSQRPTNYLVFYIELLLQCLSPMTPNLRKYVQKNVISTLQLMCTYKSISFNQISQRLSIKSNNHLYIYCLRTSTKWRTISLLKDEGKQQVQNVRDQDCVLEMSSKGNYIALMTYRKLYVWRLSSGFWSGILGAFSQGWNFDLPKQGKNMNIVWDQTETAVTVVNQDPSLNIAFRV